MATTDKIVRWTEADYERYEWRWRRLDDQYQVLGKQIDALHNSTQRVAAEIHMDEQYVRLPVEIDGTYQDLHIKRRNVMYLIGGGCDSATVLGLPGGDNIKVILPPGDVLMRLGDG